MVNRLHRIIDILCIAVCIVALFLLWRDRTDLTAAISLVVAVLIKSLYEEVEYHG